MAFSFVGYWYLLDPTWSWWLS